MVDNIAVPEVEKVMLKPVYDKLILTWQKLPTGSSLIIAEHGVDHSTYSGMHVSGELKCKSNGVEWMSTVGDYYVHFQDYCYSSLKDDADKLALAIGDGNYNFDCEAITDSEVICWFTNGVQDENFSFEYTTVDGELEIQTNQMIAFIAGECNANLKDGTFIMDKYDYITKQNYNYTINSNGGMVCIVTLY
jgi:hypothetical protein